MLNELTKIKNYKTDPRNVGDEKKVESVFKRKKFVNPQILSQIIQLDYFCH